MEALCIPIISQINDYGITDQSIPVAIKLINPLIIEHKQHRDSVGKKNHYLLFGNTNSLVELN